MNQQFYVGYRPRAPRGLGLFWKRGVLLLLLGGALLAPLLVISQDRFDPGRFEWGVASELEGRLVERPYARLASPAEEGGVHHLVAPGKRGAAGLVAGLDGVGVGLVGSLIEGEGHRMIEVQPGSVADLGPAAAPPPPRPLGEYLLAGEIVDGKCFLGVMKPGRSKPHRSCAVRCISGGVPPMLWVPVATGEELLLLLANGEGGPLGDWVLPLVGRPVEVRGEVRWNDGVLELLTGPGRVRPRR